MSRQHRDDSGQSASLARSSAIMFAGTLVSRLLGFVRNALVVVALGATASGAADAFNTANALPTQLYNLLLGGILNAVLVPQIVRALKQDNGDDVVNRLLTAAGALVAVVTGLMTLAAPLVVKLYASGLGRWQPLAVAFTVWCMPQIFFYGLTALWGQVLNARERFGPYMWAPVVNNIIAIASLLAYIQLYGSYAAGGDPAAWSWMRTAVIAGGATLGIVVQALTLYLPLRQIGFKPKLSWGVRGIGLRETSIVASWALAGVLITGLSDMAWTNLGSAAVTAAEGAASSGQIIPSTTMWNNAQLVYILPQSLITTSIVTALFTRMSIKAAERDALGVRDDFSFGARTVAVFTMLASAGIAVLATPALQAFVPSLSLAEAQASAPILVALALGIVPQGLFFTAQRVLLAYSDTRRLFWAYAPLGIVPVLAAFAIHALAPAPHWMTLAAVVNTLGHLIGLAICAPFMLRYIPDLDTKRIGSNHLRLGLSAGVAALVGIGVRYLLGPADGSLTGSRPVDALVTILLVALVMTVVYALVAALVRVEELSVATGPISRILRKVARLLGPAGGPLNALASRMAPPAGTAAEAGATAVETAVESDLPPSIPPRAAAASLAAGEGLPPSIPPRGPVPVFTRMPARSSRSAPLHQTASTATPGRPVAPRPVPVHRVPAAPAQAVGSASVPLRPVAPKSAPVVRPTASAPAQPAAPDQSAPESAPVPPAAPTRRSRRAQLTAGHQIATAPQPQGLATSRTIAAPKAPVAAATPSAEPETSNSAETLSQPSATMDTDSQVKGKDRGVDEGKPIGSGRYRVLDTMPTTLPHIIRHRGKDTILDRDVTILLLTPATAHREEVLSAAARAVLIDDQRCQRIYDVDQGRDAFIVSEPTSGVTLPRLVEQGLSTAQARAVIGESAQALACASLRNLHHLVLRPESIRVDASGQVKVAGIGIDGAARGMDSRFRSPLLADKDDAKALVELLYYAVTGRWPGKRSGIRPAPRRNGAPVPPSEIASGVPQEIDALCERTWKGDVPRSAAEVAALLEPWPKVQPPKMPDAPAAPAKPAISVPAPVAKPAGVEPADAGAGSTALAEAGARAAATASTMAGATRSLFTRITRSIRTGQFSQTGAQQAPAAAPAKQPPVPKMSSPAPATSPVQSARPAAASSAAHAAAEAGEKQREQMPTGLQRGMRALRARRGGGQQVTESAIPTEVMGQGQLETPQGPGSTRVVDIDSVRGDSDSRMAVESDLITIADDQGSDLLSQDEDSELEELVAGEEAENQRTTKGVLIAIGAVVLLVVLFAFFNLLSLAKVPLTDREIPAAKTVPTQTAAAQEGQQPGGGAPAAAPPVLAGAQVLDGEEHTELAGKLTDGDPNTNWYTRYYNDPSVPNNGKPGIGVAFKLQAPATVSAVELQGTANGGHFQLRSTTAQDPAGGTLLAEGAFVGGTTSISVSPTEASNLVLWVTELPRTQDGKNRVTISEVVIR
ncbi:Probable peptidoglycan biosynthesis protein MurJ [Actinomyces bovis]|uniref:Probable peptidoglycan biosynthesis protein MurJ n=1 Tax=Actinomyces bovis TaxID=1658 RepID=A0ABY1VRF3_9ACTO|nr:murein biosynthesis integral membrane protein MurJ [Actinomyces bovis]SPT54413.1 Probable peptidoglycan biosynthesis protein MurJ [Actinomyces bovis]VEG56008.1 Probable peptidoglycan biosynthesis protein MurJ [Actinomyces israelii]